MNLYKAVMVSSGDGPGRRVKGTIFIPFILKKVGQLFSGFFRLLGRGSFILLLI